MSLNRLKQLEKMVEKKLGVIDNTIKLRFPIIYSSENSEKYTLTKSEYGKFIEFECTKEKLDEYIKDAMGSVSRPEEANGVIIFKPEKNKE